MRNKRLVERHYERFITERYTGYVQRVVDDTLKKQRAKIRAEESKHPGFVTGIMLGFIFGAGFVAWVVVALRYNAI